jgi:hypothetical protein
MQVLKQQMKPTQVKLIYLTKDLHLQETFDWLVKDPEAWDWLCSWWASDQIRAVLEQNQLSKKSVHLYSLYGRVRKT